MKRQWVRKSSCRGTNCFCANTKVSVSTLTNLKIFWLNKKHQNKKWLYAWLLYNFA